MIGGELARRWSATHHVTGGVHEHAAPTGLPTVPFDLMDPPSLARLVDEARPEVVVHCAAWANADACERDPDGARRANVDAVRALARACRTNSLPLVAFSTDLVLPGDSAFTPEIAAPRPILVYGSTKLEGERALLDEFPGAVAARVALVTGRGHRRPTASETIAWALRGGSPVRLFTDQFRTPVDVASVGDAVLRAFERGASGVFNLGGPERLSRYELGVRVAASLGLRAELIEMALQGELAGAPRPADVSMDITRARRELGWEPAPVEASIADGRKASEGV